MIKKKPSNFKVVFDLQKTCEDSSEFPYSAHPVPINILL